MMGAMKTDGMALPVAGHSAVGPGCVGAVYHTGDGTGRTVAVFAAGTDEGVVEREALWRLAGV